MRSRCPLFVLSILILVFCWAPAPPSRAQRKLTANFRVHADFRSQFLSKDRGVLVWLPPGYDTDLTRRYPVLYTHDGPNVFVLWRIDEIAEKLIASREIEPLIIVSVSSGGTQEDRLAYYTPPPKDAGGRGGKADLYGRMLVEELKPFIDSQYRTLAGASETGLGGSSLGGLVTLHLGLKYPTTFGKLAVMSPAAWWGNKVIVRRVKELKAKADLRIWLDVGTEEGPAGGIVKELRDELVRKGWQLNSDLMYLEDKGAQHTDQAWAQRSGQVLKYLFPQKTNSKVPGP